MDQQLTFADSEFSNKRRQTRKEKFLGRMDKLIPWARLEAVIEPHYPKAGNGRLPYPLSTMLRIHHRSLDVGRTRTYALIDQLSEHESVEVVCSASALPDPVTTSTAVADPAWMFNGLSNEPG